MNQDYKTIIRSYFKEHSFVDLNIQSFNRFIEAGMSKVIMDVGDIIPTIIPQEVDEFKITIDKVWVERPTITEADGSQRPIFPIEARLRTLTYNIPVFIEISSHINGIKRETIKTEIGRIPVMLRSKYCNLHGLSREELIKHGEDPDDHGGYFILNGNERVMITVEDLAPNKLFVEKSSTSTSKYTARVFSEGGAYRIPHLVEQMKDGIFYISFTRFKRIPILAVIKALGMTKDQEITKWICSNKEYDDVFINLYETLELKTQDDALDFLSKKGGLTQTKEERLQRVIQDLDKYLLPHLGSKKEDRMIKAYNLCKFIKKFLMSSRDGLSLDDRDHYMNKRLRLSGDLLEDLFRVNLRVFINDMLYNFQRLVKRGKFHSIRIILREKLLTSRIKTAMATGSWVGGRKGISQNIDRANFLATSSHLQRIVSLLSATQENFEARALHPTHWGKLCPIETPEGTPIGLKKNSALLNLITNELTNDEKIKKIIESHNINIVK